MAGMIKAIKEVNGQRIRRSFAEHVWNSMPVGHYGWTRAEYMEATNETAPAPPTAKTIEIVDPLQAVDAVADTNLPVTEPKATAEPKKRGCKNCGGRKK